MRPITFPELLAATNLTTERIKVLRQRDQIALAFGRSDAYQSLGYVELDAVAHGLVEELADKLDRNLAARIVRDLWGVWTCVVALAEGGKGKPRPAFFFVVEYEDKKGRRDYMALGHESDNVRDVRASVIRLGLTPKNYFIVDVADLLSIVRRLAKQAGYDFSAPFLPPYGDPKLEEILKPFGETDRAIITSVKAPEEQAEQARRAGIMARAHVEASLPAMPRGRLQ